MIVGRQPDWRHTGQDLRSRGRNWGIRQVLLWRSHLQPRHLSIDHGSGGTRLRRQWYLQRSFSTRKWSYLSIGIAFLGLFFLVACSPKYSSKPQDAYDRIQTLVRLGD